MGNLSKTRNRSGFRFLGPLAKTRTTSFARVLEAEDCKERKPIVTQFSRVPDHLAKPRFIWTPDLDAKLLNIAKQKPYKTWKMLTDEYFPGFVSTQLVSRYSQVRHSCFLTGKWSLEELGFLNQAYLRFGSDWVSVSKLVGTRKPIQCFHKWNILVDPKVGRKPWTSEESEKLIGFVLKCPSFKIEDGSPDFSDINWNYVSSYIPGKTRTQVRTHFIDNLCGFAREKLKLPPYDKGQWTPQQNAKLIGLVDQHYGKWTLISFKMKTRTPRQCKSRWMVLRKKKRQIDTDTCPKTKKNYWTVYEDEALLRMYRLLGPKWTLILDAEPILSNRSRNTTRQRVNLLTSKSCTICFVCLPKSNSR